ncbi:MAG: hypothetical protein LBH90_08085 [Tannerella sp.]|nr:hypothetical protein [Tannerella sp.]
MKTIEKRGTVSASSPMSDVLKSIPPGAEVIAAGGSRSHNLTKFEMVYSLNGAIAHLSFIQEGGES